MMSASVFRNAHRSTRGGRAALAALLAASALTVASSPALAAVVCFAPNIAVPVTTSGLYVNLFDGTVTTATATNPNWNFNPWGSGNLFLWGATNTTFVQSGSTLSTLVAGTPITSTSTFSINQPVAAAFALYRAGVGPDAFLGVRFSNAGTTYYGWITMTTTAPTGLPTTLHRWCYDNTGGSIIAGTLPVSLQSYSVE